MNRPLEYETPPDPPPTPWYAELPLVVLFVLMIVPIAVFSRGGRHLPGERWTVTEIFLPPVGYVVAIVFAALSYSRSSPRRRVGLLIIGGLAALGIFGAVISGVSHW